MSQISNNDVRPAPARIICILGMHRSGTSCLTGSLQNAGIALGDIHTWNPYNKKGNRENQRFVDLHDSILEHNGGAWDEPPASSVWRSEEKQAGRELLESYAEYPLFGFKDPRVLLVLEGWKQLYPDMEYIGSFRHPNAVAESLRVRSDMPRNRALKLWYVYNKRMLQEYKKGPFPILCFDDSEENFHANLNRALDILGVLPKESGEKFWEERLRGSQNASQEKLPWRIGRLYRKLRSLALR
ncbi:sulfotransferase family protein [Halieaceae bacterium IMCC14734]|uniref:Sulfotransferase family protein n=1 Tax=Candidatus Litorirhabdus singularis TaxID=2518993 RepID=A0ABT3TEC7_9GAMM|nr:hypothetical protein [Candidatus Litorirhabdus singularis]MCX2980646.1 sulfotransferase family protein [Candidatus Litorirhabdus singularis]